MSKIKLYNMDCMELMTKYPDGYFDLAVVDPPYFSGPNLSGYYGKGYSTLGIPRERKYKTIGHWSIPDSHYFDELQRVSRNQIIWGANHFADRFNAAGPGWILWDKDNGNSSFADGELAFTSFNRALRIFRFLWNGMHQGSMGGNVKLNQTRIHPTQKPIQLYDWIFKNYAGSGQKILDTHLGSASSAIAAHFAGLEFVGSEIDTDYFNASMDRFENETAQKSFFDAIEQPCKEQFILDL